MTHIDFYFDPISPYAYLAFERLPEALAGLSYNVSYRPALFAGMLAQHGQKGPAEIEPKRAWTFRQVHWLAQQHGIEIQTPTEHPFNPLALLRLAIASAAAGDTPNRHVCEQVLRHVWRGGANANDPARLAELTARLAPTRSAADANVKQALKDNTDQAIALGVFGVPSLVVDGKVFWGLDALPMLRDFITQGAWFDSPAWSAAGIAPPGVRRA
jgi:2-hydroxychromene-2-carboxylate isomerase